MYTNFQKIGNPKPRFDVVVPKTGPACMLYLWHIALRLKIIYMHHFSPIYIKVLESKFQPILISRITWKHFFKGTKENRWIQISENRLPLIF